MDRWDLFVWLIAPLGLIAALGATWFAFRKRNWPATAVGFAASLAGGWVAVTAPAASSDSFDDLATAAVFAVLVVPLTAISVALSLFGTSGWKKRFARG